MLFQSTRPHGARLARGRPRRQAACFNPRAHMERDTGWMRLRWRVSCFNPRAHMERDLWEELQNTVADRVSIHAPTWSATYLQLRDIKKMEFQSTRPHGARLLKIFSNVRQLWFQSTRPHGARLRFIINSSRIYWFQSTRPHGARHSVLLH